MSGAPWFFSGLRAVVPPEGAASPGPRPGASIRGPHEGQIQQAVPSGPELCSSAGQNSAPVPAAGTGPQAAEALAGRRQPLLGVSQLNAWYGAAHILFDVSLEVGRGEVVALMGRNGAGKSTTLKSIMGLIEKWQGDIHFMGQRISGLAPYQISRLGLGFVPEDRRVFTDLTVAENLEVGRQPPRYWPDGTSAYQWTPSALYKLFPNLGEMQDRNGGHMSGGEQQMLTVARTLMGNPFLVLLDEPSEGVAPLIVEQMASTIIALKQQGVSILLSEQNLHFAGLVADRVYVLEKGQIQFTGSMAGLMANEAVRRAYLTV